MFFFFFVLLRLHFLECAFQVSGGLYLSNILWVQKILFVPAWVSRIARYILEPIVSSEDSCWVQTEILNEMSWILLKKNDIDWYRVRFIFLNKNSKIQQRISFLKLNMYQQY